MSQNRHLVAKEFIDKYIEIFNKGFDYIDELYRCNSKFKLISNEKDINIPYIYGTKDIIEKLKSIAKTIKLDIQEVNETYISCHPKAIAFKVKGYILIDNTEKCIEQTLHIAMHDYDKKLYIIEEKVTILEKIE